MTLVCMTELSNRNKGLFTPEERFHMSYIPVTESGCWLWVGTRFPSGYGRIGVNRQRMPAHRYSWILHRGHIPDGLLVCHTCDVRECVNPAHLFLGTVLDNAQDCKRKGRNPKYLAKGQDMPWAKLTDAEVIAIRADKRSRIEVAQQHGLRAAHVSDIVRRRYWKHIL